MNRLKLKSSPLSKPTNSLSLESKVKKILKEKGVGSEFILYIIKNKLEITVGTTDIEYDTLLDTFDRCKEQKEFDDLDIELDTIVNELQSYLEEIDDRVELCTNNSSVEII